MRLMNGERAVLFATDPPYAVGYTGGSHPQSWGNRGAANRDKDWSGKYVEANSADVRNAEEAGVELYRGLREYGDQACDHPERRLVLLARQQAPIDDAGGDLERVRRIRASAN